MRSFGKQAGVRNEVTPEEEEAEFPETKGPVLELLEAVSKLLQKELDTTKNNNTFAWLLTTKLKQDNWTLLAHKANHKIVELVCHRLKR